jgi:hypothetical protein
MKIRTRNTPPNAPIPPADAASWVRLPTRGHEPHCGLTRGAIYALIRQGRVRTSSVPVHGSKRGIRLIWLPSLMAIIEKHATGPMQEVK